ncbi:ABC transporter substrate-binding protein [Frigidibacter albus]|uniref:ABC transporter substrate-binding protein n=2 Tax=Frigidibacter albus TaxID=1465486 RepID=A0A6L8VB97_9RHOB|nr:ABC transporter substrate-binding protein [Frigidibacter albus]NBE29513.1 ABC transporter substrate-binding protein [Frigidibacter albus]
MLLTLAPIAADAQPFPQTFTHMYGETVVAAPPERVVSLGYIGHDNLLAIGVVPVAIRHWFGDTLHGVWPWAEADLGEARPMVLRGEVSMEAVAALQPDLILAVGSGINAEEYAVLSQIAPTVASEAAYGGYNTPWDVHALTLGRATGRLAEAEAAVAAIRARMAAMRAAHPGWQGQTGVAAYLWAGEPGAFLPGDTRANLLIDLGFAPPPPIAALASPDRFFAPLSPEDLAPLEAGVLVWMGDSGDASALAALPLRRTLRAHAEGREIWADPLLAAAMSHASLSSLPYALDRLEPELAAAADGDTATPVPSAVAAGLAP